MTQLTRGRSSTAELSSDQNQGSAPDGGGDHVPFAVACPLKRGQMNHLRSLITRKGANVNGKPVITLPNRMRLSRFRREYIYEREREKSIITFPGLLSVLL